MSRDKIISDARVQSVLTSTGLFLMSREIVRPVYSEFIQVYSEFSQVYSNQIVFESWRSSERSSEAPERSFYKRCDKRSIPDSVSPRDRAACLFRIDPRLFEMTKEFGIRQHLVYV